MQFKQDGSIPGADVIAVYSTGQSLLDYVPYGITTEGFGGTYATVKISGLCGRLLTRRFEEIRGAT